MRRFLASLLSSVLLVSLLTIPAGATSAVQPVTLIPVESPELVGGGTYFSEGMAPAYKRFFEYHPEMDAMYIRSDGKIIDFDGAYGFHYSEGLTAVVNSDYKVGYADREGNLVIPYQFDLCCQPGVRYAGKFVDGLCPVYFKTGDDGNVDEVSRDGTTYGQWKTIDRNGNVVSDTYDVHHIMDTNGMPYDHVIRGGEGGEHYVFEANGKLVEDHFFYEGLTLLTGVENGEYYAYVVQLGGSGASGQPPKVDFTPDWHAPELPDYNADAPSLFASHAKVTGFHLGDLDFGSAEVTITNPTKLIDAGVIAVSFVNVDNTSFDFNGDGVFFVAYELAPGESREYSVLMSGIINQGMFTPGNKFSYAEQFNSHVESAVWMFEDDADLLAFYDSVPYEQHWYPRGNTSEFQPICDGQIGTDWLRDVADTVRKPNNLKLIDYYLPDGSTIQAGESEHATYCPGFGY